MHMGNRWAVLFLILMLANIPSLGQSSPRFSLGLDLRLRYEDKQDFNFASGDQSYGLTRLRINGKALLGNHGSYLFAELQDARVHGEDDDGIPPVRDDAVPNIFVDELDLHQAYLSLALGANTRLKIGRQKFNFADKRMVASLEWANVARVFDAARLTIGKADERSWDIWASQPVTVDPDDPNDWDDVGNRRFDSQFYGLMFRDSVSIEKGHYELFLMHRRNSDAEDEIFHLGGRLVKSFGKLAVDVQAHSQFGDWSANDHGAYAYALGASYAVDNPVVKKIGAAYLSSSGDDAPFDDDHDTFDNLYPLNHAYYGFMDFFGWQNMTNLEFTVQGKTPNKLSWRIALHRFLIAEPETDAWYNAGLGRFGVPIGGENSGEDHAGDEIDLTLAMPLMQDRIKLLLGYSRFLIGDYVEVRGGDNDASFWYLQSQFNWSYKK